MRRGLPRCLAVILLVCAVGGGCDRPFHPFLENGAEPFWIFGYLDLRADTQWVRVTPIRQNVLADTMPIDAVVTLEKIGSGQVVTLRDSLFSFADPRLDAVTYAHNFWTTERLDPQATYRLTASRSDGASTTATIEMPSDLEFSLLNLETSHDTAYVEIHAERVLFVATIQAMRNAAGDPAGSVLKAQKKPFASGAAGTFATFVDGTPALRVGLTDVGRTELRIAAVRSDWPFDPRMPDLSVSMPATMPSNVENGVGYVGGVATWTVPFHRCAVLAARPGNQQSCAITYNARSASITGTVIRMPCDRPQSLADVRLVEAFADGGAVSLRWRTDWNGRFRFEGIEPGADLVLHLGTNTPPVHLPRLGPGQRHFVGDLTVQTGC